MQLPACSLACSLWPRQWWHHVVVAAATVGMVSLLLATSPSASQATFAITASGRVRSLSPTARPACAPLALTRGAVVYWPSLHPEMGPPPPPSAVGPAAAAAYWSVERCSSRDDLGVPDAARPMCPSRDCDGVFRVMRLQGCPASARCGGGGGVTAPDCPPLNPFPLANGSSAVGIATARALGPDELLVMLEGPEVAVLGGTHVGRCVYDFPFAVSVPGTYRLTVTALRADWAALDESQGGFPRLTLDNVAGDALLLTIGDAAAAEAARVDALALQTGADSPLRPCALRDYSDTTGGGIGAPAPSPLPPIGRWLRTTPSTGMFDPHRFPR